MASASDFLNSLGVNTHAAFGTGAYQNTSLTVQSLAYLGITSVRDGFREYGIGAQTLDALADAGIKISFLVSTSVPEGGETALANFISGLEDFLAEHPGGILGIEGLNEANIYAFSYQGSSSVAAAAAFQKVLYAAVNGSATLGDIPVLNMTIGYDDVDSYAALGDLSDYSDFANVHTYTHTRYAADATQEYQISLAQGVNSQDPLVITETGYTTLESFNYLGVSEAAQAKLILNGLFDAYENGSQKTYLYELFDGDTSDTSDSESHFGLFHTDGSAKPAAVALHNLTSILAYGDEGDAVPEQALDFTLSGMPSKSHSMLLTKANGAQDIVLWAEPTIWDDINNIDVVATVKTVQVDLGAVYATVYVYDPLSGTDPIAVYTNVDSITVPLSDHPVIIEVGATSPVSETVETVAPVLTMTAEELVARIDYLSGVEGLNTVNLTGEHVLHVSSAATMRYMIEHYQDVLGKIAGGYSFTVEVAQSTWRMATAYDASGTVTSVTEWVLKDGVPLSEKISYADGSSYQETYKNGVLVSSATVSINGDASHATYKNGVKVAEVVHHASGAYDSYDYGITGQKYTTQHQVFTASGKIQLLERFGSDGFSEVYKYDTSTGKIVSFVQHTASVDSYYTYFSNGSQKATYIRRADGSSESYDYGITGANYASQHQVFDTNGKISLLERWRADGTLAYIEKHQSTQTVYYIYNKSGVLTETTTVLDAGGKTTYLHAVNESGDYTYYVYNAAGTLTRKTVHDADYADTTTLYAGGVKTSAYIKYVSGKSESYDYGVTGQKYTTQHQVFDASGKILLFERTSADGYSYTAKYDSGTGKLVSLDQVEKNGSESHYTYTSTGVMTSSYVVKTDGASERYQYGITGQDYVTEHKVFNATGQLTLLERMHADGSRSYMEKHLADSTVYYEYNHVGVLSEMVTVKLDGSKTVYDYAVDGSGDYTYASYDKAGVLTVQTVHDAGVSDVTSKYTAGLLATVFTSYANGTSESLTYKTAGTEVYLYTHQTFDTAGKLVDLERFNAAGATVYTETHSGQSTIYGIYTASGVKTETTTVNADGSRDSYYYSTTTAGMVTHTVVDAAGNTQFMDVEKANGTHAVTAYGQSLLLAGGVHDDTFVFKSGSSGTVDYDGGHDQITGFSSTNVHIDLADGLVSSLSDLNIYQSGADTIVFIDGDNSIALKNVALSSLSDGWIVL